MHWGEIIVAGTVLVVCLAMLVRLALGSARRAQFDRTLLNAWHRGPLRVWNLWQAKQARRRQDQRDAQRREQDHRLQSQAEAAARQVIDRARDRAQGRVPPPQTDAEAHVHAADRDGNVIRPHAFRKPEPGATHSGNDTRH